MARLNCVILENICERDLVWEGNPKQGPFFMSKIREEFVESLYFWDFPVFSALNMRKKEEPC